MDPIGFPDGAFIPITQPDRSLIRQWISDVRQTPQLLKDTVGLFSEDDLELRYKPGGWTIRQIVHHIADNDMNVYFRFKRTLTEERPVLPAYEQDLWAE